MEMTLFGSGFFLCKESTKRLLVNELISVRGLQYVGPPCGALGATKVRREYLVELLSNELSKILVKNSTGSTTFTNGSTSSVSFLLFRLFHMSFGFFLVSV